METFVVENERECGVNTINDGIQTEIAVMKGSETEEAYWLLATYSDEKIGPSTFTKIPLASMAHRLQSRNILGIEDIA